MIITEYSVDNKEVPVMQNAHTLILIEETLGKREVMNGVKDISLSYSVITDKTVDAW
jgi:hypothetical protein